MVKNSIMKSALRLAVAGVLVLGVSSLVAVGSATAQSKRIEFKASTVLVLRDSATMRYHKDYRLTIVSGVVGKAGIPIKISLGDVIRVKDRSLKVNHIFATRCLEKMAWGGEVLCERGQVSCFVVERPEDRPTYENRSRLWVYVKHCKPTEPKEGHAGAAPRPRPGTPNPEYFPSIAVGDAVKLPRAMRVEPAPAAPGETAKPDNVPPLCNDVGGYEAYMKKTGKVCLLD